MNHTDIAIDAPRSRRPNCWPLFASGGLAHSASRQNRWPSASRDASSIACPQRGKHSHMPIASQAWCLRHGQKAPRISQTCELDRRDMTSMETSMAQ
jgi:hypothetical protein